MTLIFDVHGLVLALLGGVVFYLLALIALATLISYPIVVSRSPSMQSNKLLWLYLSPEGKEIWWAVLSTLVVLTIVGLPVWLGLVLIVNGLSKVLG